MGCKAGKKDSMPDGKGHNKNNKVNKNKENKKILILLAVAALFLAVSGIASSYIYNPGDVPNPGHPLSQIQGYLPGQDNLEASLANFCQGDGTNCKHQCFGGSTSTPTKNGNIPSLGHKLAEIQGYFSDDSDLSASLNHFCRSDGTNCKLAQCGMCYAKCAQDNDLACSGSDEMTVLTSQGNGCIAYTYVDVNINGKIHTLSIEPVYAAQFPTPPVRYEEAIYDGNGLIDYVPCQHYSVAGTVDEQYPSTCVWCCR